MSESEGSNESNSVSESDDDGDYRAGNRSFDNDDDDDDDHDLADGDYEDEGEPATGVRRKKKGVHRNETVGAAKDQVKGSGGKRRVSTSARGGSRRVSSGSSRTGSFGSNKATGNSGRSSGNTSLGVGSVVNTARPPGSNTNVSDISSASFRGRSPDQGYHAKYLALKEKYVKQKELLKRKKDEVTTLSNIVKFRKKARGKNKARNKEKLTPLDDQNRAQVNNYIRQHVYPNYKILPPGWSVYNENPRSFCQHIMARVKVPNGMAARDYWDHPIRTLVNEKYSSLKANFKDDMKHQTWGKICFSYSFCAMSVISNILYLHISSSSDDVGTEREYKLTEDGALFDDLFAVLDWSDDRDDTVCLKNLITFIDYYVAKVIGTREVAKFHKNNRDKTLLDALTPSDFAYTTLVYENSVAVWKDMHAKKHGTRRGEQLNGDDEDGDGSVKQKYHFSLGTRLKTFACGWTEEGVEYMKKLEDNFKALWRDTAFVDRITKEWRDYVVETGKYQYKVKGSAVQGGDLEEEFDSSPFLLDMPAPGADNVEDTILED